MQNRFPLAVEALQDGVTPIDERFIRKGRHLSRYSPRRRIALPLHRTGQDPLQRMVNVLQPGTYIRPHRHRHAETILLLRGRLWWIAFDPEGRPAERGCLAGGNGCHGVDLDPGIYHTLIALQEDTVLFEAKSGPFHPQEAKDFAPWAPAEGDQGAGAFLARLLRDCHGEEGPPPSHARRPDSP